MNGSYSDFQKAFHKVPHKRLLKTESSGRMGTGVIHMHEEVAERQETMV
jgi:hypothetical protein